MQTRRAVPVLLAVLLIAVIAIVVFWMLRPRQAGPSYFADSTPLDGSTLPASPIAIVLNFTSDVSRIEELQLQNEGHEVTTGEPMIDELLTSIRLPVEQQLPDGSYTVSYNVCFAAEECQEGTLSFGVDRSLQTDFVDLRGQDEVRIDMEHISFNPANIIISPGTTVTWQNNEPLDHYINTDTHPYHTYVLDMNSRKMAQDDEFSFEFTRAGAYPYHCSAHADVMSGIIVVDDGQTTI